MLVEVIMSAFTSSECQRLLFIPLLLNTLFTFRVSAILFNSLLSGYGLGYYGLGYSGIYGGLAGPYGGFGGLYGLGYGGLGYGFWGGYPYINSIGYGGIGGLGYGAVYNPLTYGMIGVFGKKKR